MFTDSEPAGGGGDGETAPEEPMEVADQTKEDICERLVGKGEGESVCVVCERARESERVSE